MKVVTPIGVETIEVRVSCPNCLEVMEISLDGKDLLKPHVTAECYKCSERKPDAPCGEFEFEVINPFSATCKDIFRFEDAVKGVHHVTFYEGDRTVTCGTCDEGDSDRLIWQLFAGLGFERTGLTRFDRREYQGSCGPLIGEGASDAGN